MVFNSRKQRKKVYLILYGKWWGWKSTQEVWYMARSGKSSSDANSIPTIGRGQVINLGGMTMTARKEWSTLYCGASF